MNNQHPAYIYGLYCPLTGVIKYVGMTNNPPARYAQHLADKADTPKVAWMNELRAHGVKPIMGIIEECTEANVRSRELFWIEYYLSKGIELTNSALGFEQKTVRSVARYYMSHLRPKRAVMTPQIAPDKTDNGQGVLRPKTATQKVFEWLNNNPNDINLDVRSLAERIGIGKTTVATARKEWLDKQ